MRVTIDLDRDIVIVPDNFFKKIAEENERLVKFGANPVKPLDRIKNAFKVAMADTDARLLTQSNAKVRRTIPKSTAAAAATDNTADNKTAETNKTAAQTTTPAATAEKEIMGAPRVTPQEIVEMHRLYAQLGNYAAVGRKIGRSGSTVAKYIKLSGTPQVVTQAFKAVVQS